MNIPEKWILTACAFEGCIICSAVQFVASFGHQFLAGMVIGLVEKSLLAAVAPLSDMAGYPRRHCSGYA